MSKAGRITGPSPDSDDVEPPTPSKNEDADQDKEGQTRFESKRKLLALLNAVAKGKHEYSFISLARHVSNSTTLDLSADMMKTLRQQINEIWTLY